MMRRVIPLSKLTQKVIYVSLMILLSVAPFFPFLMTGNTAAASFVRAATPVTTKSKANNPTLAISLGSAATQNNLIVVVCSVASTITNITVTGYSTAAPFVSGTVSQGIFYKIAGTTDTTATCKLTGKTNGAITAQMYEYSGVTALDATGTSSGTTTAVSSGTATPTTGSSMVFTAISSLAGTAFTVGTTGYAKRTDTVTGMHIGMADISMTTSATAQSYAATNSAAGAWHGQIVIFKATPPSPGLLSADIIDSSNNSVANPSVTFPNATFGFICASSNASLGSAAQKLRVSNTTSSPAWEISIAPTGGPTAVWSDGVNNFDSNDPTAAGCVDGGDSDGVGGQLFVKPSTATITPGGGCTNNGVTKGADTAFSQGVTDSIPLVTASTAAGTNCYWDVTGLTLSQTIPAEQNEAVYNLSLTLTLTAK